MAIAKKKKKECLGASQSCAVQAAIDYGIDISMLMDNIKRTPAERIRRHQMALAVAEKLRRATQNE